MVCTKEVVFLKNVCFVCRDYVDSSVRIVSQLVVFQNAEILFFQISYECRIESSQSNSPFCIKARDYASQSFQVISAFELKLPTALRNPNFGVL